MLKKQYFHNNILKIHIKLHEIGNFLEELQSKQAIGGPGGGGEAPGLYRIFNQKIEKYSNFWSKIEHFIRK